jgi:hypothetical protein
MATKPATAFVHATFATYTVGPFVGSANKLVVPTGTGEGWVPGQDIDAESANYLLNIVGDWLTNWVLLGSNTADEDAHIVETDATGVASLVRADLGGGAVETDFPLTIRALNAGAPIPVGAQIALADAICIDITNGSATRAAATIQNNGGHYAAQLTTNGASGTALFTSNGSGSAVIAVANGAGSGIEATASSGPAAAFLNDSGAASPIIVAGRTVGPAPTRGSLLIPTQVSAAAAVDGEFWKKAGFSGFGRGAFRWVDDDGAPGGGAPGYQTAWSTQNGQGREAVSVAGPDTEAAGAFKGVASITLDSAGSPGHPQGDYEISVSSRIWVTTDVGDIVAWQIRSSLGGVIKGPFEVPSTALAQYHAETAKVAITLGGAPVTITLEVRTLSAPNPANIDQIFMTAKGAFE